MQYFFSLCLALGCAALLGSPVRAGEAPSATPLSSKAASVHNPGLYPASGAMARNELLKPADRTPVVTMVPATPDAGKALPSANEIAGHCARDSNVSAVRIAVTSNASAPTSRPSVPDEPATAVDEEDNHPGGGRSLARVTAYWASEGDYFTRRGLSATGVHLRDGLCAVDPAIIPYGSVVEIAGVGKYLAMDTGSAVVSRTAAREGGHTFAQRHALVVDLFFEDRDAGERFAAAEAKFVAISWWTPTAAYLQSKARSMIADADWSKIESKQL